MQYYRNRIMYSDSSNGDIELTLFHNPEVPLFDRIEECKALYYELNMNGLRFDMSLYYPHKDLEILKEFERIKSISIGNANITNFDGLKYAPELKEFSFSCGGKFDFSIIADRIETLFVYYGKNISNIDTLKKLSVLSMYNDNNAVVLPDNIEILDLVRSKRTDFEGLKHLKKLRKLDFAYGPKVESLDTIPIILEEIEIQSCSRLVSFEGLFNLGNPKRILIRSKHVPNDLEQRLELKFPNAMVDAKKG